MIIISHYVFPQLSLISAISKLIGTILKQREDEARRPFFERSDQRLSIRCFFVFFNQLGMFLSAPFGIAFICLTRNDTCQNDDHECWASANNGSSANSVLFFFWIFIPFFVTIIGWIWLWFKYIRGDGGSVQQLKEVEVREM